ncbi:putative membrane protein [Sphaerochaeta pleomorpha str. Grapes]|uniref:Putative membrane protein n=1 Tax=Sphaerochaeta pleomorpha (strain ATCC BAA-1885 / DSM 22778 / Grapes) TaxID=158190 RepID=G8QY28_SPHPG|nr:small multi-drug export protein [Sphaerochaeta pleomorpha]AEV28533.1 putative membrane protein [Sphaerochaeta pleomorpha str. Grapes]
MDAKHLLISILLSILPISELRGGIPYAFFNGFNLAYLAPLCIFFNALVAPICYTFLATFHKIFYAHWPWYISFFDHFIAKAQHKIAPKVEKYGYWGIMLFVAIPLPVTGAWTGTLGSWILGLDKRKTMMAVFGGVIVSGLIVTSLVALGVGLDSVFIKKI